MLPYHLKPLHRALGLWLFCFFFVLGHAEKQPALSEEEKIVHVLNRLGFGPGPGDIEKVKARGLQAYTEQQLHPERIPDPLVGKELARFDTLTMDTRQLAGIFMSARQERRKRLQRHQQESSTPDPESPQMRMEASDSEKEMRKIQFELAQARLVRAVHSERQLQEILVDFWMNHFNVFMAKGLDRVFMTDFEQNVIRPQVLGKFEDLLMATAKSPAMLFYLDNWLSSAPAEVMQERISKLGGQSKRRQQRGAMAVLRRVKGLNENYARELMELHTLGVDGGYTQEDVIQVARCFTGWTISPPQQGASFRFEPLLHDQRDKVVLGHRIRSEGIEEGEQVIRLLARHPSTAQFISWKLARRFVSDEPPQELVQAAAETFRRTEGDIREVLRAIFNHPQFFSPEVHQAKIKKPFEFLVSSLRATEARFRPTPGLLRVSAEMGEALYLCPEPTGYPDVGSAWITTDSLLKRMNFAAALANGRIATVRVSAQEALPLLHRLVSEESDPGNLALMLGSPEFQKK